MKYNNNSLLLAVDMDGEGGFAMYRGDGTLWRYGATPVACCRALRRSAKDIVSSSDSIGWLISAGDVQRTVVWERLAFRSGIRVQRVRTCDWSSHLLAKTHDLTARRWQCEVLQLAAQVVRSSKMVVASEPLSLQVGKAILVGFWATHHLGLMKSHPQGTPQGRSLPQEIGMLRKPVALVG